MLGARAGNRGQRPFEVGFPFSQKLDVSRSTVGDGDENAIGVDRDVLEPNPTELTKYGIGGACPRSTAGRSPAW